MGCGGDSGKAPRACAVLSLGEAVTAGRGSARGSKGVRGCSWWTTANPRRRGAAASPATCWPRLAHAACPQSAFLDLRGAMRTRHAFRTLDAASTFTRRTQTPGFATNGDTRAVRWASCALSPERPSSGDRDAWRPQGAAARDTPRRRQDDPRGPVSAGRQAWRLRLNGRSPAARRAMQSA